ncbi:unnamed protein product [Merluccius merluccius]
MGTPNASTSGSKLPSSCLPSLQSGAEELSQGELEGNQELGLVQQGKGLFADVSLHDDLRANAQRRSTKRVCTAQRKQYSTTKRRDYTSSPSDVTSPLCQGHPVEKGGNQGDGPVHPRAGGFGNSRWSTLSWDASSDLQSPPTLDSNGMIQVDSDSRPSSGFYSVSGSSLSDSCYSVSSEAALGLPGPPQAKPPRHGEQTSVPGDPSDARWVEGMGHQQPVEQSIPEDTDGMGRDVVSGDFETAGLSFLSDLCSSLGDPQTSTLVSLLNPLSSLHLRAQLDPHYCTDLVSRRTKEVYSYPSPLHAVALQSPLFTPQGQESSASTSAEGPQLEDSPPSAPDPVTPTAQSLPSPPSLTQLEQYISRLAHQYRSRASASTLDLTLVATPGPAANSALRTPSKGHGSTQSLSAFESRMAPSSKPLVGSATPCKSLMGNSAKVSLSSIGKKASRNSINLGNLPSATGEDLNISLHLNLNLNLAPGVNSSLGLVEKTKNGSCGALRNNLSTASSTSATSLTSTSTATPGLRTRSRISTCPSTLSHRSSLEVVPGTAATPSFGSQNFCRSLDWSSSTPPGAAGLGIHSGSAPGSQRSSLTQELSSSPKLSEDSAMVEEIVRLSGLSRAVVVGLMEQGVELDVDCFQVEPGTRPRSQGHQPGFPYRMASQADHSHPRAKIRCAPVDTELNPPRPLQLSLSVTHSPQSHSGLTPPLSHSPRSQASLTPPLSHANSPMHPYHSAHAPALHYPSSNYQQVPFPSELPSSTASSPASRPLPRGHSPPRPLQQSPLGSTPLSVFRRDAPSQCSLRGISASAPAPAIRPRGGSLRQSAEAAAGGGGGSAGGWRRSEGEGLYRGKHASRELIRASTVSSYTHRENYSFAWGEDEQEGESRHREASTSKRTSGRLWRGWDGRLWGKESNEKEEMDRAEYGYGWSRNGNGSWRKDCWRQQAMTGSCKDKRPTVDSSPSSSRTRGSWEKRSSSLRLSRRTLFRSESQGLLVPRAWRQEPRRATPWVSSLDVARSGLELETEDGVRPLEGEADKHLSSTASLFNLSRSQSLEGSCQSLSPPLSSPSFSPSPPPRTLQRSRSLRDLGKRMFGSMRSLSLKKKSSKK